MYKDYVENQLPNRFVHETEKGFITYHINGIECQLEEIYVKPEFRRKGVAVELRDFAANDGKEKGCEYIKGSVVVGTNMAEESCMAMLKYGYKFWYTDGIIIYFKKELGE
jgi:GNAT superfamily N-acetyltransferase